MAGDKTAFFSASESIITRITLMNALVPIISYTAYNGDKNKMKRIKIALDS